MTDPTQMDILVQTLVSLIESESSPVTVDSLKDMIKQFSLGTAFGNLDDVDLEVVERHVLARVQVVMASAVVLEDKSWIPWVNSRRADIDDYYWNRYVAYLDLVRKVPRNVRSELHSSTDKVLDMTYDPLTPGPWDRRGLVMGNVQSGKTQHYTGLIAKAADAGYKIIVVIAGIHDNLRNQTQERIDEAFVGRRWSGLAGSKHEEVGVSLIGKSNSRHPASFTGAVKDFNRASAQSLNLPLASLGEPAVFVVKKNPRVLRELIDWLQSWNASQSGKIKEPILLIDDEADNASIDVGGRRGSISTINKLIRELLSLFDRSSYVGYTATPFANIFIDPSSEDEMVKEDLFPRSFIIDLDPPSNYLGPQKMFLEAPQDLLREIHDSEPFIPLSHKIDLHVGELPPSLVTALHCYLLSRAIRTLRRDETAHSAMMINVTRFNRVQEQLQQHVQDELQRVRNAVKSYSGLGERAILESHVLADLHSLFEIEYADCGFSWLEVLGQLHVAISPIDVVLVNMMKRSDPLHYEAYRKQGRHVIAIGGLSLSRGLTLEGLTVSYFLRNSKMYDTLLQMGRWFGYRDHYEDLVRVWMPEASIEWYEHITEAVQELRSDLRAMADSGLSPVDFGLKVRRHPATLLITARNKFGRFTHVTLSTSFSNRLVETVRIRTSEVDDNLRTVEWLGEKLLEFGHVAIPKDTHLEILDVSPALIREFITRFQNAGSAQSTLASDLVIRYLEAMSDEISAWDISIPTPSNEELGGVQRGKARFMGHDVMTQLRTPNRISRIGKEMSFFVSAKQRASSRGVEAFCLPDSLVQEIRERNQGKNIADSEYRQKRTKPMLMVHFIKPIAPTTRSKRDPEPLFDELLEKLPKGMYPVWGVSFPDYGDLDKGVESSYHVNATWLENEFGNISDEAEDEDENAD